MARRVLFLILLCSVLAEASYFQQIEAKLPLLQEPHPEIFGTKKPIDTLSLVDIEQIPLFMEDFCVYPKIYGFRDIFLLRCKQYVAVIDANGTQTNLVSPYPLSLAAIAADTKEAYILLNSRLYRYDGKRFALLPYSFRDYSRLFIDQKSLYLDGDEKLVQLSRIFPRYQLYKKRGDDYFCFGANERFYYKKDGFLRSVTLDNRQSKLLPLRFCIRFKSYYLTRSGTRYILYRFPKKKIASFSLQKAIGNFFILKNWLYLISDDKVVAKFDLATQRFEKITPRFFYDLSFDANDNYVAYYRNYQIHILDANLTNVATIPLRKLPDIFSIAISRRGTVAYLWHKKLYLNGRYLFTPPYLGVAMDFDGTRLAVASFEDSTLQVDIFDGATHRKSFRLPVRDMMLRSIAFYKSNIIALFMKKALIIHDGRILKEIPFSLDSHTSLQKRGSQAYLNYDDKLIKIDLNTLQTELILSGEYGIQKGEDFTLYTSKFLPLFFIVDFGDRKVTIASSDDIYDYHALRNYAIIWFKLHPHKVLVVGRKRTYWLTLTSVHNKILALYPLWDNRFALMDGFGLRIVDLDTFTSRRIPLPLPQ